MHSFSVRKYKAAFLDVHEGLSVPDGETDHMLFTEETERTEPHFPGTCCVPAFFSELGTQWWTGLAFSLPSAAHSPQEMDKTHIPNKLSMDCWKSWEASNGARAPGDIRDLLSVWGRPKTGSPEQRT